MVNKVRKRKIHYKNKKSRYENRNSGGSWGIRTRDPLLVRQML